MNEVTQRDGNGGREMTREQERFITPAVDIYEQEHGLTVLADLPGIEKDSIDVTVDNRILTIKATVAERENKEGYREFKLANYFRQFELGEKISSENIQADYNNGVLKLNLPLAEEAKPRKIEVSVA